MKQELMRKIERLLDGDQAVLVNDVLDNVLTFLDAPSVDVYDRVKAAMKNYAREH